MDLETLAPEEAAVDLAGPAPEEPVLAAEEPPSESLEEVEAVELEAVEPEAPAPMLEDELEPFFDFGAAVPEAEVEGADDSEPVYTRTLAELYVRQGFTDQAIEVYRHLLELSPDDRDLQVRIAALEAGEPIPVPTALHDERIEELARDLAESGAEGHDVDTPFAWSGEAEPEEAEVEAPDAERISAYFDRLLGWEYQEPS